MIIKLHENLINKIAAGEVVERPASVLKELIENSIDAKSTRIDIKIEKAGLSTIEVSDNGEGMSKDDAQIACDSHSTSKISTIDDLDKIHTMGFRGEALASIAAVSDLTLETNNGNQKEGYKISIDNGKSKSEETISKEKGTKIMVKRLFHKIPARKKFLKTENTEYRNILETFHNYALAYPNIHFTLTHNNKSVYKLPSTAKDSFNQEVLVRINDMFGENISKNVIEINYRSPYLQIKGYAGHPKTARARRTYQSIYLNRRPVSDKLISKAVYDAYHTLIPKNRYPIFFLFLEINPTLVDVNVHPRKSEVRFSNSSQIFSSVKSSIRQTMLKFLQKESKGALEQYKDHTSGTTAVNLKKAVRVKKTGFSDIKKAGKQGINMIDDSISFTKEILKDEKTDKLTLLPKAFQIFNSIIVIEKDDKILFVDQHAAAERVTYEKLMKQLVSDKIEGQKLLIPETIELKTRDFDVLKESEKIIRKLGIGLNMFGKNTYKIDELPSLISDADIQNLINDILDDLSSEDKKLDSFEKYKDKIIATMSCHSSIRAGMKLDKIEIDNLVKNLLNCKNPYSCPHGRPVIWELSRHEIEKNFERH